jgi:hypothetical protein
MAGKTGQRQKFSALIHSWQRWKRSKGLQPPLWHTSGTGFGLCSRLSDFEHRLFLVDA